MTQPILSQEPVTYQIVVTSLPADDNSPPPNHSADIDPKKKPKPYKSLSKSLFLEMKLATSLLIGTLNPNIYLVGSAVGISKPIYDWKFNKIVPKRIDGDANQTDFGRFDYEGKASYVLVGLLGPFFVAAASKEVIPLLSLGIIGFNGFSFWQEITERFIRWIDPVTH